MSRYLAVAAFAASSIFMSAADAPADTIFLGGEHTLVADDGIGDPVVQHFTSPGAATLNDGIVTAMGDFNSARAVKLQFLYDGLSSRHAPPGMPGASAYGYLDVLAPSRGNGKEQVQVVTNPDLVDISVFELMPDGAEIEVDVDWIWTDGNTGHVDYDGETLLRFRYAVEGTRLIHGGADKPGYALSLKIAPTPSAALAGLGLMGVVGLRRSRMSC